MELYAKVLAHTEEVPSGAKYNEDIRVFIYDDGHIELTNTDINADPKMCYLYQPQVRELLKFLIEHVELIKDQEYDPEIDNLLCA